MNHATHHVSLYRPDMREWQECAAIIRAPDQKRQTTMKKVPFKYHLELLAVCGWSLAAKDTGAADNTTNSDPPERWNLYYQATSIGQRHGPFNSPYQGPFSLQPYSERDVSLTTTLFFGLQLDQNTQFYFDPEIAGGRGLSRVDGLANAPNGELPRIQTATPKPYIARLYISHDFGFGSEKEHVESESNQLAGERPMNRYTVTVGRFTLTDFFD